MISYRHSPGVAADELHGRPALALPRESRVAVDADVLSLWRLAHGRALDEIAGAWHRGREDEAFVRAALGCLAEARLLERVGHTPAPATSLALTTGPVVSAVVITHTTEWMEGCLGSLVQQRYAPLEIILVDNNSADDVPGWVAARFPSVRVIRLPPGRTFSQAVNAGVAASTGTYVAILNPDIEVEPDAIGECVRVAEASPEAAAVAAKLMFWWAPAFLNGIGNRVDDASWGTDNFIGHLDLGQFDELHDVPSVCFAATLVRRSAWDAVGWSDEAFPLYYEDAEWSYRARLLGYRIVAAPRAVVRHVFGYKVRGGEESDLTPRKLAMAVYGRLRFANKLLSGPLRRHFVRRYLAEDTANFRAASRAGQWPVVRAYLRAWRRVLAHLPAMRQANRALMARARIPVETLFAGQQTMPAGLLWSGVPELSRSNIEQHYLPLLAAGRTRPVPEWQTR
jgi:GT2 family glycosyltransferase